MSKVKVKKVTAAVKSDENVKGLRARQREELFAKNTCKMFATGDAQPVLSCQSDLKAIKDEQRKRIVGMYENGMNVEEILPYFVKTKNSLGVDYEDDDKTFSCVRNQLARISKWRRVVNDIISEYCKGAD